MFHICLNASANGAQKKGPKAHALAKPLPAGEVLTDHTKKGRWKIGKPIGQGGFGLIYLGEFPKLPVCAIFPTYALIIIFFLLDVLCFPPSKVPPFS
jgi:hypothetical protein